MIIQIILLRHLLLIRVYIYKAGEWYQKISSEKSCIMVMKDHRRLIKMSFTILAQPKLPRDRSIFGFLVQIKMDEWQRVSSNASAHSIILIHVLEKKSKQKQMTSNLLRFLDQNKRLTTLCKA